MRTHTRRLLALVLAAGLSFGVGGCGDDDEDTTATGNGGNDDAAATTAPSGDEDGSGLEGSDDDDIVIDDFKFTVKGPVKQNDAVAVNNKDSVDHTVTMDEAGGFDVPVSAGEAEVFSAVRPPGSYPFHCKIHPQMKATLVIE